jgi:hypothetical protein
VSQAGAAGAARTSEAGFAEAHRRLLSDSSIQFQMSPYQPPETPAWLKWLADLIKAIWPVLEVLFWAGVAALGVYILYIIAQRLSGSEWRWRRRSEGGEESQAWRPEEGPARALLREADALAGQGRYSEAAHLLLFRSIEDIDSRRPQLVRPALTSRDIAGAPELPPEPKRAFATIVALVERSLFGGRDLAEPDWRECRSAYERFAFAGAWR